MKTMTALKMEAEIVQLSLIWITALIIAPSQCQDIPRIKNLDCMNDFVRTMVCFWEVVNGVANCSSDFQLKYTDFSKKTLYCQDIDNEYYGGLRVPSRCICNITTEPIVADEIYNIEVVSEGQSVGKATIDMLSSVKPKPPSNVRVTITDQENVDVRWKTSYGEFIDSRQSFHIQFISKKDDKTALEDVIIQSETQYPFSRRQLSRGEDYRVRVRMQVVESKELWSEWSPEILYRNDYDLTISDFKNTLISVSCISILFLTVSCFFCIRRTKEIWWNNIPNPARSKLAAESRQMKKICDPTDKRSTKKSCVNCLSNLVKAHKCNQFTKETLTKDYPTLLKHNMTSITYEPERVLIERCIQLYPLQENLYQEDSPEEDIHLMVTDMSIGRMFCDILCDSSVKMDALEQFHEDNTLRSSGLSILWDNSLKTERHLPLSMVSQESGYRSYDSDYSAGESKSDGPNQLYFGSLSEGDFLPYAPATSINERGSNIHNEDVFVNSGYNSFASALGEAASDFMEGDNISVFSLGTIMCKPNYHSSIRSPKSILYYNRGCFPTCYEDDLRPTITSTSDHTVETPPTSVSEEPGYQSFNQAVQQGETSRSTTSLVFNSGYKPFESLTRLSTSSLDSIDVLSELDGELLQKNEDPQQAEVVNAGTHLWNDTQSYDFPLTELNFFGRKYPYDSEMLEVGYKGLVDQALDLHHGVKKTFKKTDNTLALTFDIGDHLRNFENMQGHKRSPGLDFPTDLTSLPCSLDRALFTHDDHLLDKSCLHTNKSFPMKFENMSYFVPLYHLRTEGHSHLLVQQNNMDEEGNSYLKIALW